MTTHVRDRFAREYGITSEYDLQQLQAVLDEHAHQLAEELREHCDCGDAGTCRCSCADRIDTEVPR